MNYVIEEVADTNTPAMRLYEKLGFEENRRKPIPEKVPRKWKCIIFCLEIGGKVRIFIFRI